MVFHPLVSPPLSLLALLALLERMFWSLQRWEKEQRFSSSSLLSKQRRKRSQHLVSVYHQPGCNMAHRLILSNRLLHRFHSLPTTIGKARLREATTPMAVKTLGSTHTTIQDFKDHLLLLKKLLVA